MASSTVLAAGLAVVFALLTERPAVARYLLDRCPDLIDRRYGPHETTLLHLAVEHDEPRFVDLAIAHGVDIAACDRSFGATALGWARHLGRDALAQRLAALGVPS